MPVIPVHFVANEMAPNEEYVYSVTPVGYNETLGHVQSFTIDSLAILYDISLVSYDSSSIILSISGAYQYLNVVRNGIVINPKFTGNVYIDTDNSNGLVPDTSYAYIFTPYNHIDEASAAWPEIDVRTLTGISSVTYTSDISSINMTINGVYNYVDIYSNLGPTIFKLYDQSFTDLNVAVNSGYIYTVVPHDVNDVSGVSYTLTAGTQPQIYGTEYTYTTNTIALNVSGAYSNYSVARNSIYVGTVSGPYFVDTSGGTNLPADTSYNYVITPHNTNYGLDILGEPTTPINIFTLPLINSLAYTMDSSSVKLSIDGLYAYVSIDRDNVQIVTTLNDISYTDTELSPDVSYSYVVTPYNSIDVSGQSSTLTITTSSIIYAIYPTYDTSSVTINISGAYAYVDISRNGRFIVNNLHDVSYTDMDISGGVSGQGSGLMANQIYSYSIIPHNWNGIIGTPYSFIIDTLPIITNVSYTSTVHTTTLTVSGYYSYYSLSRDGVDISNNVSRNTYKDSGRSADICYNYVLTPYNSFGISGAPFSILGVETLPEIYNIQYVSTDASSVTLTISGSYTYFNVSRNGTLVDISMSGTVYVDRNHGQGLPADASYNYSIKPYNSRYFAGNTYVLSIDTLPILFKIKTSTYDTNSVTLNISGIYDYINLFRNGTLLAQHFGGTSYLDNINLDPNSSYIYSATPYNSNDISGNTIQYTQTTLPIMYACTGSFTTNSVTLSISGSYQSVNIVRGNTNMVLVSGLTDISYTDYTVMPNTNYTYIVTPFNTVGVSGTSFTPLTLITTPKIYTTSYVSTINSTTFSISGAYQSVFIKRDNATRITGLTDSSYTDIGLMPDISYVYSFVPYNSNNVQGDTYTTTVETYPQLQSVNVGTITTSSITINISGAYIYFDVSRNGTVIATGIYDSSYTDISGLSSNIGYRYGITPYNALGFTGSVLYTPTISPYGSAIFTNYSSATINSIIVNFTGPSSYNYVKVARITNGNIVSAYSQLMVGDISFSDTGLVSYNSYSYNIIPYNVLNVPNGSITTPSISVIPTVTFVGYSNISKSGATITFSSPITFSYVNIARITDGSMGSYVTLGQGVTSYRDTGLSAAKAYTYSIQPCNAIGAAGTAIITSPGVVVLPSVTFANFSNGTPNSVQLNFIDATTYSYIKIARIINGSMGSYQQLNRGDTSFNDIGLFLSNIYSYSVIPYNYNDVSGTTIITPYNSSYASVNFSGNVVASSATSVSIPFTGQYTTVSIFNDYLLKTNIVASPYTFSGLLPNTNYNFTVTPYNGALVAGTSIYGNTCTWGIVTGLNPVSTIGSLSIGVSGSFYSAIWTNNTTSASGTLASGAPFVINDTSVTTAQDVSYSYTIVPYNAALVPAYGFGIFNGTVYTASTISSYNAVPAGTSVTITASGSFYYIGWRNNVTNVTGFSSPGSGTFTDSSGVLGNNSYTYTLTPYTHGSGPSGGNTIVTTSTIYTWGTISNTTPTITGNTITMSVSGSYAYYNWTNTVTGTSVTASPGITSFIDVSGLYPNTGYTYNITPYNSQNTPATGTGIFTQTKYTLGNIVSAIATNIQSNFIVVTVSGNFTSLTWQNNVTNVTGNVSAAGNYVAGSEILSFFDASLNSTTNYTYTIIPYNYSGIPSSPYVSSIFTTTAYSYYIPGLQWTVYGGYFNEDVGFGTSPSFQFYPGNTGYAVTNEGAYMGFTSNLAGLVAGTNGNIIGNGGNWHTFCCEWVGFLYTQSYSGTWTFTTSSDDGSYLWVGVNAASGWTTANATVQNGGLHGQNARSGTATLNANTYYPIRIQFSENGGGFEMVTTFQRPDGTSFSDATGYLFSLNNINSPLTFQIKPISASMPTMDNTNMYSITNNGGVSVVTDPAGATRKYVFQFNGSNSLSISAPTPAYSTRTFWIYTSSPTTGTGNVYNSTNYNISFNGGSSLISIQGGATLTSSVTQTTGGTFWKFYAIITTPTSATMYLNANTTPVATVALSNFTGDSTDILFGSGLTGYMDDLRLYPSVLNTAQLYAAYTGSDLYTPYQFRLKPFTNVVSSYDNTHNFALTNSNNVTVVNDPAGSRGYVYQFNGSNYLSLNATTYYYGSTKTFWVYTSTPSAGQGNVFSSTSYTVWFQGTNFLNVQPGSTKLTSNFTQGAAWTFYAITVTSGTINMYINGSSTPTVTTSASGWSANDTTAIQFGAYTGGNFYTGYLDDMRMYPMVLTASQISAIYTGTDLSISSTGANIPTDISSNVIALVPYATTSTAIAIPFYGTYSSVTIYNGITSYSGVSSSPYSYTGLSPNTGYTFKLTSYDRYGVIGNTVTTGNTYTLPTMSVGTPAPISTSVITVPFTGAYTNATLSYKNVINGLQWVSYNGHFNNNANYASTASLLDGIGSINTGFTQNLTSLSTATNSAWQDSANSSNFTTASTPFNFRIKATTSSVPTMDTNGIYSISNTGGVQVATDPLGKRGYVLFFPTNSIGSLKYLTVNGAPTPATVSMSFWVYSTYATGEYCFLDNVGGGGAGSTAYIRCEYYQGEFHVVLNNGGTIMYNWQNSPLYPPNTWVFYTVTINASAINVYINSILVSTTAMTTYTFGGSNANIVIGVRGDYVAPFTGYLDDIRQYPVVLTQSQINAIYNGSDYNVFTYSQFSVQWLGLLYTQTYSGNWNFSIAADDNAYMWLGNKAITNYTTINSDISSNNSASAFSFPTSNLLFDFFAGYGSSTTTNGGTITSWTDKRMSITATGSGIYNANIQNGLPMVSSGVLTTPSIGSGNITNWTYFLVCKFGSTTSATGSEAFFENPATNGIQIGFSGDAASGFSACYNHTAWAPIKSTATFAANGIYILTISYSLTGTTGTYVYRTNGVDTTQSPGYATTGTNYVSGTYIVSKGSFGGTTPNANGGYVGEQILYNSTLTLLQIQQIEQHLAYTWGIAIGSSPQIPSTSPFAASTSIGTTTLSLTANTYYPLRILYGQKTADYNFTFSMTPPGQSVTSNGTGYFFYSNNSLTYNSSTIPNITSSPYLLTNLQSNTPHILTMTPYNAQSVTTGTITVPSTIYTLPNIVELNQMYPVSWDSLYISLSGSYNYYSVKNGNTVSYSNVTKNMFPTAFSQTIAIIIGNGGVGGFSSNNGTTGGNTTVTYAGITITANGGSPGLYNVNSYSTGGTATGGSLNIAGGLGSGASGNIGGGGGGAIGSVSAVFGSSINGQNGVTAVDISGLAAILTPLYGSPGAGLGGPSGAASANNVGLAAYGWGSGGGGAGYFGGDGGAGSIGGGGGGGASGNGYNWMGGNGGTGLVVCVQTNSSGISKTNIITASCNLPVLSDTVRVSIWAIGGGGGGGGATSTDTTAGGGGAAGGAAFKSWTVSQYIANLPINNQRALYSGLNANTQYNFTVTPYNVLNLSGTSITTSSVYTLGNVISGNVSNMPNSTDSLRIDFSGVFTNLSITNSTTVGNIITSPYIYTGLAANTGYTFNIIPYNIVGLSGAIYSTNIAYTLPTVTVGQPVALSTSNTIKIPLFGSYAYVSISNNVGTTKTNVIGSSYNFTGLSYNQPYIFTVTPYNASGTPGLSVNTVPVYTTTSLSLTITPTIIDPYDISINFSGSFYNVSVNNGAGVTRGNILAPYYTFSGLNANSPYTFTVIPYNGNAIAGASSVTNTVYTWGNAIIKPITDISTNYINFPFDGSYSWVNIGINGTVYNKIVQSPYKFSGLNASAPYNLTITPYNVYGAAGQTLATTVYTLPYASIGNLIDGSSVNVLIVPFSGVFGNVSISNGAGTTINGITTSPYQFGGLVLNTQYTFSITPYNGAGVAGLSFAKTVIYIAKYLNELPYSSYSDVSLTYVNVPFVGSFNTVSIGVSGGTTVTGISSSPYKFTDLIPNTIYTFYITPYDSGNNSGVPIISTVGTLANINTVSVLATSYNTISVGYSGNNSSVGIATYAVNNVQNPPVVGINANPYSYNTGLLPNSQYTFYVYPYNSLGMWNYNDYAISSPIYTWGVILTATFTGQIVGGSMSITGIVTGYFSSIYWKNMITGTVGGPIVATDTSTFTDTVGITVGITYKYNIMPINADGLGPAYFGSSGTFVTTTVGLQYPTMSNLSASAYNSCRGAYACYLLNSNYSGPILQLRNSNDPTSSAVTNFYSDPNGNFSTRPFGAGITVGAWASNSNFAYVVTWYDQSNITTNHATQTNTTYQPVYDISNHVINFGYSGSAGGYVGIYNSNAYFNLPNGAIPYADASYSIIFKHWNIPTSGNFGFINGGLNNSTSNCLCVRTNSNGYFEYWGNKNFSVTANIMPNNVISTTYVSGSSRQPFYVNSTLITTGTMASPRTQVNTSNFIGVSNTITTSPGSEYINGQIYYMYVFNSSLTDDDRLITEGTVTGTSTNNTGTALVIIGKTLTYTTAKLLSVTTTITITSVLFDFAGYFQTLTIDNGVGNTITGITASPYNFTGLTSGTPYTFTLTPYNSSGISGNVSIVNVSTPVNLVFNSATTISSSAIQLSYSGATQSVTISNGAGITIPSITSSPYTFSGLNPNTPYTFTITPISYNISGTPYVTTSIYTFGSLSLGTITDISSAYISIPFSGINANVTISNGTTVVPSIVTSPYQFSDLTANSGYRFNVTPYNAINIAGNTLATPLTYTLPYVIAGSPEMIDSASVSVPFTGLFNNVTIDNSAGIVYTEITSSPYTFTGLDANTSYMFNITPYNVPGTDGTVSTTTSVYTGAAVAPGTPVPVSGTTDISIPFFGSFSNVTIATTTGITKTSITTSPYTFTDLSDNTQYTFIITPYNSVGVAGTAVYTDSVYTNAKLLSKSAGSPTSTTITITASGNDKSLSISNGLGTVVNGITSTPYVFTGLTPNTAYTFAITPYNYRDLSGIIGTTSTIYTLGTVALGIITDISDTYIGIPFTGINANISIANGLGTTIYGVTTSPYKFSGLLPNTAYNFTLTPYNSSGLTGNTVTSGPVVTNATAYADSPSDLSSTAISVPFTGTYNNVAISNGISTMSGITVSPYAYTNLLPNTSYTFTIVPYNSVNAGGLPSTSSSLYTWGYVVAGVPSPLSGGTSMSIPFTGTFTNVSIRCSNGSNVNSITTSPYTFTGLLPNTSYTFTVTPYNASGVAGTTSTTSNVATYPTLSAGAVSDLSASAISIPFSGSYSNVTISNGATTVTGITSSPYTFNGLTANTSYTFSIIPYNLLGVSGSTVTTSPLYTWGYVVAGTPSDVSGTTSISIPFTGIFSNVSISNGSNVYSGITTSPYVFSGLGEYVLYSFTITPYNVSAAAGFTSTTIPIYSGVTSSVTAGTPIDVSGTTSVLVPFSGSFSTVSISNNAGNTITGITASPYIFTGLTANTFYTFTITPYDSQGVPAVTSTTSTICSEAMVSAGSPSIVSGTTSISIPFTGTYTMVSISNGAGTTIPSIVSSPYVFSGLTANTSYTFSLSAYNQSGTANNPVYTNSIYTAATLYNNASTLNITSTAIDVSFSGVFTNVSVGNGSTLNTGIVTSPYHYTGLSANTSYVFTVTPYNVSAVGGNAITTTAVYTLPAITTSTPTDISVNYINVPFAATTTGSFTSVSVSNGTTTITGLTTSPYKFTGLTANTPYTFTITPYGAGGATGTPVNTTSVYTSGQVSAGTPTTVSATVVSVLFSATTAGSFTNVSISNGMTTVTGITVSPYSFSGLTANTSYAFTITPYNVSTVAGPSATTASIYTWPAVNAGTPGNVSDTVISVPFTPSTVGSFTKVSISNGTRTVPGITTSPYSFTGLTANTSYTFTITPIGVLDVSGTAATTTSLYTWPFVNGGTITDVSATTLSIPFTASTLGSFTNVSISNGAGSTITGITTSPYSFGGLNANTTYTFTLTPYNVNAVAGSAVVFASRTTLPYVNAGTPSTSAYNTISVPFSASTVGSFTKVSISNGTLTVPGITTSPYSFTGLVANTSYTFTITPINSLNISGTSVTTTSLYTLPVVNSGTITDVSATTLSIPFTASTAGSFTTVTISNGAGSIITGITTSPYSFGGLNANTSYTFTATPYNASGVAGTAATYSARTTLPYVNVGVPTTSSFSTISVPFSVSTVSSFTNVSISNGTLTVPGITTSPYSFTGLTANTSYTFTVTPINTLNVSGSVVSTTALYTLGSVTNTYYDGKTTLSTITGDVSGKFNYISWTNQTYAGNTGTVTYNALIGGAVFTDSGTVNALVSNTQYTYSIYPYNSATTPVIGALTTFSAYTLGKVTGAANRGATTASLTIDVSGVYSSISWTNTTRANTGTGNYVAGIGGTTFSDTGATNSLSANTLYSYSIVPVNVSSYNGTAYTSLSAYTLASIAPSASNFYISAVGTTYVSTTAYATMTLTWATNATFSKISVALVTGAASPSLSTGTVGSYTAKLTTDTSHAVTSGLSYNTYYYFSIIPYNTNNVASTAVSCYAGAYTWAYITTISPVVATAYNAISITFAGSYTTTGISTALVTGVNVPPVVGVTTSPYSYTGLAANTSYTFYFYPYNASAIWSTSNYQSSGAVYTWGSISSATYTSTSSAITVTVNGLFSSVNWKNNTTGTTGSASGTNSVTFTDSTSLSSGTGYTYTLAPMNVSGLGPATTNGLSGTTTTGTFNTATAVSSNNLLTAITAVAPLWGAYSAEAWTSGTLTDLTGNGRNATTSGVTYTSGSGNGATASINYLYGTNTSYINWPAGSIPSTFTLASLISYAGGGAVSLPTYTSNGNGRILQATTGNWLHCHWAGQVGVNHYDGWRTPSSTVSSVSNINNWVIMVSTNNTNIATPNNAIVNGVGVGTANGGTGGYTLTINSPNPFNENSYFNFSQLLIWPSGLTTTQMQSVNTILQNYLNGGTSYSIKSLIFGFTPTSITGLQLWLDAKDPYNNSTIPVSNTAITTWSDKSGNARNATGVNNPLYNNGTVNFSTANNQYLYGSVPITGTTMSVFIVATSVTASTAPYAARIIGFSNGMGTNDFNNTGFFGFLRQNNTGFGPYRNGTYINNNPPSYNTNYLWECWFDGTNEYASVGGGGVVVQQSAASAGSFAITTYAVGSNTNTGDGPGYMNGSISEVLVFNTALSISDRQSVEGYLAWKWSLQTSLPSYHPYYSATPSVSSMGYNYSFDANYNITGTSVSSWGDSSNIYMAVQSTTSKQPTITSNYINGLKAVVYAGSGSAQVLVATGLTAFTTCTTFVAFLSMYITSNPSMQNFMSSDGNWNPGSMHIIFSGGRFQLSFNGGGDFGTNVSVPINTKFTVMVSYVLSGGNVSYYLRLNGVQSSTYTTATSVTNIVANALDFGGWQINGSDGGRTINGGIGQILLYNYTPTASQITAIESYMMSKW